MSVYSILVIKFESDRRPITNRTLHQSRKTFPHTFPVGQDYLYVTKICYRFMAMVWVRNMIS